MDETPGVSDQYRMASPWPVFVAVGFVLTELGLFVGLFPIAVAGVLLFGGSVSGILTESGYVSHLWRTLATVGVVLAILGVAAILAQGVFGPEPLLSTLAPGSLLSAIDAPNAIGHRLSSRGLSVGVAGLILVAASVAGYVSGPAR
jgi:hypothetical protein